MNRSRRYLALALSVTLLAFGCSSSSAPQAGDGAGGSQSATVDTRSPQQVAHDFLEAVRTGDDKTVSSLLTPLAYERTSSQNMVVAPPGSETARFAITDCTMIDDNGARVTSDWTDLGPDGRMHTDRILWMLRKVENGWRIAGMASKVFPDRPAVVLNYEDPEDMMRQQEWVDEELARRAGASSSGAAAAGGDPNTAAAPSNSNTEVR